ncbi:MAG TPA: TRAP transporter fused permease subunit, partial [Stellaceae bacterium]|nr:TRAP transporter fused permease subunit [Stellaceae bacterium]
ILGVAIGYLLLGSHLPGQLGFRDISYQRCIELMYLGGDGGMFGQLTGISANELILFIMFGAFLARTGIGEWFGELSAAIGGRWIGGSAKIAVMYSALFGGVAGSPTADLYATGVYTIPLMKRTGFDASYAAGLAAASAVGSQIMPPLMGASIFIMAALLGRSFASIAAVAIVPALLFFLAKGVAAHFQAKRDGVGSLPPEEIPRLREALKGIHYLLPIVVLIVSLYSGFSPIRSALYGLLATFAISFTKRSTRQTPRRFVNTLAAGARATIVVAIPCAAAGVIVSMLTQTGLGLAFSTIIGGLAGGSVALALVLAAIAALILGIGVPTTPAYILTAAVAAPALVQLGVDPLGANLFVLYFAVLSNIHPPVGITAYAAAGIAEAPPMRTGLQAIKIAAPGFVIPFAFAFHPALLFAGSTAEFLMTLALTAISVMGIAAGLAGYLLLPLSIVERLIVVGGACLLIAPSRWIGAVGGLCLLAVWLKQALQRRRSNETTRLPVSAVATAMDR